MIAHENVTKTVEVPDAVRAGATAKGYVVGEHIDSGAMRDVFLLTQEKGEARRHFVMKVPKTLDIEASVTAHYNAARRGDWNLEEITLSNSLPHHPNIAPIVDSFTVDGLTINIEPFYDGTTLDQRLLRSRFDMRNIIDLYRQIVSGVSHLHSNGIAHRDIKPDNILVTPSGVAVLTDYNIGARESENIDTLFTRGAAAFTSPGLINQYVAGQKGNSGFANDVYALGTLLMHMCIGEAMPYAIEQSDQSAHGFVARLEGKDVSEISFDEHKKILKKKIKHMRKKGVPKKWCNLTQLCMTTDIRSKIRDISTLERTAQQYESEGWFTHAREFLQSHNRSIFAMTHGATVVAGLMTGLAINNAFTPKDINSPYVVERYGLIYNDNLRYNMQATHDASMITMYGQAIEQLEEHRQALEDKVERDSIAFLTLRWLDDTHGIRPREGSSWMHTSALIGESVLEKYAQIGNERESQYCVPTDMIARQRGSFMNRIVPYEALGAQRLRLSRTPDPDHSFADVLARYYSSSMQIAQAMQATGASTYLDAADTSGTIIKGYRHGLPQFQQDIIDLAAGIYLITDDGGMVHPREIDRLRQSYDLAVRRQSMQIGDDNP